MADDDKDATIARILAKLETYIAAAEAAAASPATFEQLRDTVIVDGTRWRVRLSS